MIRNIKKRRLQKTTTVVNSVWMFIKTFAYVIILSPVILSCSFSDDLADLSDLAALESSGEPVTINLTASTRADGNQTVEAANETDIKEGDNYRIYFFDNTAEHKYVCTLDQNSISNSGTAENGNTKYSVSGTLNSSDINTLNGLADGFIVVFIANWEGYPTSMTTDDTLDQLCTGTTNSSFDAKFNCPTTLDATTLKSLYMPFYGVKTFVGETLSANEDIDLGDIYLLRAMAKVTVVNVSRVQVQTRSTYYPDLTDVKLVHYNSTGYCAPYQVYTDSVPYNVNYGNTDVKYGYLQDDDGNYYVENIHLTGADNQTNDEQNTTGSTFPADDNPTISMYSVNDTTWIAYVPEYYNSGATTSSDTCYVSYHVKCEQLKDGSTEDYEYNYTDKYYSSYNSGNDYDATTLSFAEYNTKGILEGGNHRYDIKRNKSYRFEVALPKVFDLSELDEPDDYTKVGDWYVRKKSEE